MQNLFKITVLVAIVLFQVSCKTVQDISPNQGAIIVPAKGEIKLFDNIEHNSFSINLTNKSVKNSCEAYTVKNGNRKWISPSLPVNGTLNFSVSSSAYVLLQNYSDENISVVYTIN